jgi:hypothetical protein
MKKFKEILIISLPIILMVGLIPLIRNDYILTALYGLIIIVSFFIKRGKNELTLFVFGFVVMTISESLFISTGVETFTRNTLFGIMPLWLPFLWGYGFIAIKRGFTVLEK